MEAIYQARLLDVQRFQESVSLFQKRIFLRLFFKIYNIFLPRKRFYRTAPLNGFASKGALVNILYYYYYYYNRLIFKSSEI